MHDGGGSGEADRQALLAGGQTEAQCNVALAGSGVAERNDVLAALDFRIGGIRLLRDWQCPVSTPDQKRIGEPE